MRSYQFKKKQLFEKRARPTHILVCTFFNELLKVSNVFRNNLHLPDEDQIKEKAKAQSCARIKHHAIFHQRICLKHEICSRQNEQLYKRKKNCPIVEPGESSILIGFRWKYSNVSADLLSDFKQFDCDSSCHVDNQW